MDFDIALFLTLLVLAAIVGSRWPRPERRTLAHEIRRTRRDPPNERNARDSDGSGCRPWVASVVKPMHHAQTTPKRSGIHESLGFLVSEVVRYVREECALRFQSFHDAE